MTGSSFHWFVAWRYLMARPRRVSPAAFLVAGVLAIVSAASSLMGNLVFRPTAQRVFVTIGAHELLQCLAIVLLAQAGLHVLWGLFRYCRRQPGQVGVPCATLAALVAAGVGALTLGATENITLWAGRILDLLAIVAMVPVLVRYVRHERAAAVATLSCAVMLGVAAYATLAVARGFFANDVPFPRDSVLVRGFGLWALGLVAAEVVIVTQVLRGRASRWALAALLALGACAIHARVANVPVAPSPPADEAVGDVDEAGKEAPAVDAPKDPDDLGDGDVADEPSQHGAEGPSDDLADDVADDLPDDWGDPLDGPYDDEMLRPYTGALLWGGIGLGGLGLVLGLIALVLHLVEQTPSQTRQHGQVHMHRGNLVLGQSAAACVALGVSALVLGLIVLHGSESYLVFSARQAPQQPFLLVGVGLLALGWLTAVLGAIRYLFTFFTTVSIAGVTIGSMALVIVLSVMSGFEIDLRNKILGSNAHVLITKDEGPFTEYRDIAARIAGIPGVVAQTPYLTSEVVIAANSNYANVIIKGVDPDTVGSVTELGKNTQQPRALERLYPLADDGGIIGPPHDAGAGQEPGPGPDAPDAPEGPDGTDPPPDDMQHEWDEPQDFSGGTAPGADTAPDTAPDADTAPTRDTARTRDTAPARDTDPPPEDMDLAWGEPEDFSGDAAAGAAAGTGPVAEGPLLEPSADLGDAPGDLDGGEQGADADEQPTKGSGKRPGGRVRWDDTLLGEDDGTVPEVRISARVARLPGVLVGKELVKNLHLYVGQEVRIISPLAEDTPAGPVPRTRYLRVAGSFFTGMYEYDFKFVYVALSTLQSFLDLPDEVGGIEIRVADPVETGPVLDDIRAALPAGYRVQDWKEINRNLFSALKLEKIAMFLILAIIILVASFSIISNLIMVVVEKAKEIALLKTLGATDATVVSIFVAQGFFLGVVGTLLGVAHGLVACFLGNLYGVPLNPEVYYIDRLPIHVESFAVSAVALAGVAISVVATLYPAAMAARLQPMEGLRYD
ncbi:MAG TPA: FtsX-like permease family protein [Haliangium sp.]|nr:FtsX-like permease family protein [Haliangium sp.]